MTEKTLLVLATRNQGKVNEFKQLFAGQPIELKSLYDFSSISEVKEDGATFEENAYIKASFVASAFGIPSIADDSGLVVPSLSGAPGVHSARYAGENAQDSDRIKKLLQQLGDSQHRDAYFECVISIAAPTGHALTYQGRCEGLIAKEPAGEGGFGYDPIFYYPPLGKTFAQLSMKEKGRVSHRGRALAEVLQELSKIIIWLNKIVPQTSQNNRAM